MEFKNTEYGDLTGQEYGKSISIIRKNLITLKGSPKKVIGDFNCNNNNLTTLEGRPKEVCGKFNCSNNNISSLKHRPKKSVIFNCKNNVFLKNQKQQIIENGIKAGLYITDEGTFPFKDIKEEFEKYIKISKNKDFKNSFENKDFGLSLL